MKAKSTHADPQPAIVTPDSQEILTVDQITEQYPGEWILLQITESVSGWPEAGIIVVRGPTRDSIQEPALAVLRAAVGSSRRHHLFNAVPLYRSWDEWRATLDADWRPRRSGGRRKR